jgi:hypothetical protein
LMSKWIPMPWHDSKRKKQANMFTSLSDACVWSEMRKMIP